MPVSSRWGCCSRRSASDRRCKLVRRDPPIAVRIGLQEHRPGGVQYLHGGNVGALAGLRLLDFSAHVIALLGHHPVAEFQRREIALAVLRSEAHTSELQTLIRNSYAGFYLKKQKNTNQTQ